MLSSTSSQLYSLLYSLGIIDSALQNTNMSPSKVSNISWDTFHNTVDGKPRGSSSKHHGVNPATGEELWPVPIGTQQDVDDAVEAAQRAFESWSQVPLEKRKSMMEKFKDHYMAYAEDMTDLMCQETGKPVRTPVVDLLRKAAG